jgi:hypothetical protein
MYVSRGHIHDLYMEFCYEKNLNICIIICDGLPTSNPSKKDLMLKLVSMWYSVIAPRYKWTWESYWNFLDHSPSEDINTIIEYIKDNTLTDAYSWKEYDFSTMKYVLLWSSFGWWVALHALSNNQDISHVVLLSPLLNISNHNKQNQEQDLSELWIFIQNAFWSAYRFSLNDRVKFCNWKLFDNDHTMIFKHNDQISIIYDKSDQDISYTSIEKFSNLSWIENTIIVEWYKHISYSKLDERLLSIIDNEMRKNHSLSCGLIPINKNTNKILIVLDNENNWWFPKWLQNVNETRSDTCKRECLEEIWTSEIDFLNIEPLIINYKFKYKDKTIHKTNILFFWYIEEKIRIDNNEIKDFKRVSIDDIKDFIHHEAIINKIKHKLQ